MKIPPSNSDSSWEKKLQQARADLPPSVNVSSLLRAVRQAPFGTEAESGWAVELLGLFAPSRTLATCLAGASAFALLATWQVWECWHDLAWVQLIGTAMGGAS